MRVVLAAQAEKTHFLGMVPLAWALHNAGHEVRVATQPAMVDTVVDAGLTAVSVGTDHRLPHILKRLDRFEDEGAGGGPHFDMAENRVDVLTWEYLKFGYDYMVPWWLRMTNDPMIDDLVAFCREWQPDLVVWEAITFAGAVAAKACGAAHARFMWSVDLLGRMREHYLRVQAAQPPVEHHDPLADWLGARIAKHGGTFSEDMTVGQFTVDHLPESLRLATGLDQVPMNYVPYNGISVLPAWLRTPPERPRVCLTMGTSATEWLSGYAVDVQGILDSVADLDIELVATLPETEQQKLARIPANARLVDFAPLNALVPTCDAVINHGGPGTVFTTAAYAVPQLILPYPMFDAPTLAENLHRQGAAIAIPSDQATGDAVRQGLLRVLHEPAVRSAARELRDEMRALPAPGEVVELLEQRVEAHRLRAA